MNYKLWGILTLLATMTFSGGCGGDQQRLSLGENMFIVTSLDAQRLGYQPRWAMDMIVEPGESIRYVVALGDVIVAVHHPSNWVVGIDANNGKLLWRKKWVSDNDFLYEPSRSGDMIVINSGKVLYQLDAYTGRLATMSDLSEQVNDGPAIKGNYAIFGSLNGRVFAHDITTGSNRWEMELPAGILVRPTFSGNNVFAADARGIYALFNLYTGNREWTGRSFEQISAKPVASEVTQLIYVPSEDGNLYAVNRTTGKDRWIYRTTKPITVDPTLLGNTIFITQTKSLTAVDAVNGEKLWSTNNDYKAVDLIDQKLIVNGGAYLMILDVTTGRTLREVPFIQPIHSLITGPDDSLIVVAPDGKLERLDSHR